MRYFKINFDLGWGLLPWPVRLRQTTGGGEGAIPICAEESLRWETVEGLLKKK